MSGTISHKNKPCEGLEYVACLRGHIGDQTIHQMLYLCFVFSVHMPCLFLFMHGLTSTKQTVKIFLIGLHVLEMILLLKKNFRECRGVFEKVN